MNPTTPAGWELNRPPGWPEPPADWQPATGWSPDPAWPRPPRGWQMWRPGAPREDGPAAVTSRDLTWAEPLGPPASDRRRTWTEIGIALAVFPLPALVTALVLLVRAAVNGTQPDQIDDVLPGHPLLSSALGAVVYASNGASFLLVLFLLSGSGIALSRLGLARTGWRRDVLRGVGLVLAGYAITFALTVAAYAAFGDSGLPGSVDTGDRHYPAVFLLQGYVVSTVTALVEEATMSAYLLTRLQQLGWTPRRALWVSLALRTSYHAYYGVGFLFTVPVGYLLTRSFQRHRRLGRVVLAHALYDAGLFTLAVLSS